MILNRTLVATCNKTISSNASFNWPLPPRIESKVCRPPTTFLYCALVAGKSDYQSPRLKNTFFFNFSFSIPLVPLAVTIVIIHFWRTCIVNPPYFVCLFVDYNLAVLLACLAHGQQFFFV